MQQWKEDNNEEDEVENDKDDDSVDGAQWKNRTECD